VDELATAIADQDTARLMRIPGIGKKTAERLLLELRDKLGQPAAGGTSTTLGAPSSQNDILDALLALGYSTAEAQKALKTLPQGVDTTEGIRLALKSLA